MSGVQILTTINLQTKTNTNHFSSNDLYHFIHIIKVLILSSKKLTKQ